MINITFQIHQHKKDEGPHHFCNIFQVFFFGNYIYYLLSARCHFMRLFFILQFSFVWTLNTSVAHYFHKLLSIIIQGIVDRCFTTLLSCLYQYRHIKIEANLS